MNSIEGLASLQRLWLVNPSVDAILNYWLCWTIIDFLTNHLFAIAQWSPPAGFKPGRGGTGVRRAIEVNKGKDDLQEIIDATLREMAAEGATGSAHRQFSPRCKWTISACCILFFLLF